MEFQLLFRKRWVAVCQWFFSSIRDSSLAIHRHLSSGLWKDQHFLALFFLTHILIGRNVYKIFSAVGAPAHEAAHALAALLCGFRITNINIFKHVEFMVPSNLRGIIGSFFVSIAPALFNIIIFTIV